MRNALISSSSFIFRRFLDNVCGSFTQKDSRMDGQLGEELVPSDRYSSKSSRLS